MLRSKDQLIKNNEVLVNELESKLTQKKADKEQLENQVTGLTS